MASLVAQMVKCLLTMWENQVQSLGWEDLLENRMVSHSSIPAWRILWTEKTTVRNGFSDHSYFMYQKLTL